MMSLTFGLFNQVSGLGPLGPLVQNSMLFGIAIRNFSPFMTETAT